MKTIEELYPELELNQSKLTETLKAGSDPTNVLYEICEITHHIYAHKEREHADPAFCSVRPTLVQIASYGYSIYSDAELLDKASCALSCKDDLKAIHEIKALFKRMLSITTGLTDEMAKIEDKLSADIAEKSASLK